MTAREIQKADNRRTRMTLSKRSFVIALSLTLAGIGTADAQSLSDLAKTAASKGPVIWYESSAPEQIAQVVAAFNKTYPQIKVQYVRNTGGASIAARVIQESGAGAQTASFIIADAQQFLSLGERGLLLAREWSELGIDKKLVGSQRAVAICASVPVVLWNKNKVRDEEAPKSWDDLLAEKWRGRLGIWSRGAPLATLAKSYGEPAMRDYTTKLLALKPMVYSSTFQISQQVASGEVDIAISNYHTTQPLINTGAPIGMRLLTPVPISTLWGGVVNKGANPEGAQVLLTWLASRDGAVAYETATTRGNPLIAGTKTANLVGSSDLTEYPLASIEIYDKFDQELTKTISAAGSR
jgi:iron(III) transport system substrate-binding protein